MEMGVDCLRKSTLMLVESRVCRLWQDYEIVLTC